MPRVDVSVRLEAVVLLLLSLPRPDNRRRYVIHTLPHTHRAPEPDHSAAQSSRHGRQQQ